MCTCRPCYLLFTHDDADARLSRGARSLPVLRDDPGAGLGRAGTARRHGVPVPELGSGTGRRLLPGSGGGDRIRALARTPGSGSCRPFRACRRSSPTSRRCWSTPGRAGRGLPRPDRHLLRAGRPSAHAVARVRRRAGRARALDEFFRASARRAGRRCRHDRARVRRPRRGPAGVRGRAAPALPDAGHARPAARWCTRSRCAASCGSNRSVGRTNPTSRRGWPTSSAPPDRYGSTLKPFLWTHATAMVQGFEGSARIRPSGRLHVRLRRQRAPSTSTRCAAETSRWCCCSAARSSPAVQTGFAVEQLSWSLEASYRLPVAVWHRPDGPLLPGQRLDPARPRHHRRARRATGLPRGLTSWDQAIAGCSDLPAPAEVQAS